MKGKLVRYRGWSKGLKDKGPLALVIDSTGEESAYHHRIRVAWLGEDLPVQAAALSTKNGKISTWVSPKHFDVVEKDN